MCAESILSSIRTLQDPFFKLNSFMEMLTHRDSSLQIVCLKMFNAMLDKQTEDELERLMPVVCSFVNHSHVACRYQMLTALITVYDMYSAGSGRNLSPAALSLKNVRHLLFSFRNYLIFLVTCISIFQRWYKKRCSWLCSTRSRRFA